MKDYYGKGITKRICEPLVSVINNTIVDVPLPAGDKRQGLRTGYGVIDRDLKGCHPSELIVIGSRPGVGKTTLMQNIAANMAIRYKKKILVFNTEMTNEQFVRRMLAAESGLLWHKVDEPGKIDLLETERFYQAANQIANANIYVNDISDCPIEAIENISSDYKFKCGIEAIFIDCLRFIDDYEEVFRDSDSPQVRITKALKNLAVDLEVPIIVTSNVSKESEDREDHMPRVSDLRECGCDEIADSIIFVHRESYFNRDADLKDRAEVYIAKSKWGVGPNSGYLRWNPYCLRFENLM